MNVKLKVFHCHVSSIMRVFNEWSRSVCPINVIHIDVKQDGPDYVFVYLFYN